MMGYGWGMGGGLGMILFWILLILAIVWLVRTLGLDKMIRGTRSEPTQDRALETLRERYARGEIDSEEFEGRKRDLARIDSS
jgi:putative membrane protein